MIMAPLIFACGSSADDISLNEDVFIEIDHARINFDNMSFDSIIINNSFLQLEDIVLDIDTNNSVNLTFTYFNHRIQWANERDWILEFVAECATDEKVFFNISGLKPGILYEINRDGSPIANLTSNNDGNISFNNSDWSNKTFRIIQLDKVNYNIRRVSNQLIDDYLPIFIVLAGVAGVIALYTTNDIRVVLAVLLGLVLFAEVMNII